MKMSVRVALQRAIQGGRQLFQILISRNKIITEGNIGKISRKNEVLLQVGFEPACKWLVKPMKAARQLCYSSQYESLAGYLRKKFGWNFLSGGINGRCSIPLLGLVGISVVSSSGAGLITNHDEFDAICEQIRISVNKNSKVIDEKIITEKLSLKDFNIGVMIAKGCNAVVYAAREKASMTKSEAKIMPDIEGQFSDYPLALKMMFNYDAESNAPVILRAMYRETLPAKYLSLPKTSFSFFDAKNFLQTLPFHPNIVEMKSVFADRVPVLPDQQQSYPHALPTRLNPDGCGRNMTLFLVMKRYHKNLREYLKSYSPSLNVSIMLLTQLLEGVYHLEKNGISHRDLKSDNIMLDLSFGPKSPHLVITDFGCCSVEMKVPFPSHHFDQREGNVALMAPEIATATPGKFSVINYSKADLWAVGTLAYEIFGLDNPFYRSVAESSVVQRLDSRCYKEEDLPEMSVKVPTEIKCLVKNLLNRQPHERMKVGIAANVCYLIQSMPPHWLYSLPTKGKIMEWLALQSASFAATYKPSVPKSMLQAFLKRIKMEDLVSATVFIYSARN